MNAETLKAKIARWSAELERLHGGERWGECRRFAGKSAGNRLSRIDWLYDHIGTATEQLKSTEAKA
jgi:hypothetical protein